MTLQDEASSSCSPPSKISPNAIVEEEITQQPLHPGVGFVGDQNQQQHQHLHHRVSLSPGAKIITSPNNANTSIVDTAHTNDSSAISISSSISVDSSQTPRRKLKKKTSTDEAQSLVKSSTNKRSKSKSKMSSDIDVKKKQAEHHAVIKYGSLLLLVGQMVGLVLLMRYTRTHHSGNGSEDGDLYLASTAVFMMEVRFRCDLLVLCLLLFVCGCVMIQCFIDLRAANFFELIWLKCILVKLTFSLLFTMNDNHQRLHKQLIETTNLINQINPNNPIPPKLQPDNEISPLLRSSLPPKRLHTNQPSIRNPLSRLRQS